MDLGMPMQVGGGGIPALLDFRRRRACATRFPFTARHLERIDDTGRHARLDAPGYRRLPSVYSSMGRLVVYPERISTLVLKLIVYSPNPAASAALRARRALAELRLQGIDNNLSFLQNLVAEPAFAENAVYTSYVAEHAARLAAPREHRRLWFAQPASEATHTRRPEQPAPEGAQGVRAPLRGRLSTLDVRAGDVVAVARAPITRRKRRWGVGRGAPSAGRVGSDGARGVKRRGTDCSCAAPRRQPIATSS